MMITDRTTEELKPLKREAPQAISVVTAIVDFGNGEVKAAFRMPNSAEWRSVKFQSLVARFEKPVTDCFQVANEYYLVGAAAEDYSHTRTGESEQGKVDNALPLLIHAIREAAGPELTVVVDVLFTCPSVKQYGDRIIAAIDGKYRVRTPGSEIDMIDDIFQSVTIKHSYAQLEGHRAYELVKNSIKKGEAVVADIGSRTIILSRFDKDGKLCDRKAFDQSGVYSVAHRILRSEDLANVDGLKLCPSEADITGFILGKHGKKNAQKIKESVRVSLEPAAKQAKLWAGAVNNIFLVGGGANLPNAKEIFGAKVVADPQWATVNGLKPLVDTLLAKVRGARK